MKKLTIGLGVLLFGLALNVLLLSPADVFLNSPEGADNVPDAGRPAVSNLRVYTDSESSSRPAISTSRREVIARVTWRPGQPVIIYGLPSLPRTGRCAIDQHYKLDCTPIEGLWFVFQRGVRALGNATVTLAK